MCFLFYILDRITKFLSDMWRSPIDLSMFVTFCQGHTHFWYAHTVTRMFRPDLHPYFYGDFHPVVTPSYF